MLLLFANLVRDSGMAKFIWTFRIRDWADGKELVNEVKQSVQ